tara:strand:+ start:609 stop:800 length:192 start_codon:yes stop_codon:yes gene_type:complete
MKDALIRWAMQTDAAGGIAWGHNTPGRVIMEVKSWREHGEFLFDAQTEGFAVLFLLFVAEAQP